MREKDLQHPPELPLHNTPCCRDRIPAPLLLWIYKTFMARRSTKALSVLPSPSAWLKPRAAVLARPCEQPVPTWAPMEGH